MLLYDDIAAEYLDFAAYATGDSETFRDWSSRIAADDEVLAWLAELPPVKHQPNLVFAAARFHGVPAPARYGVLRDALLGDEGPIRATILSRATQTNEVGRLATLLPAFASLGAEPLALLEVGASAGLCLYPDRWAYEWVTDAGVVRLGEPTAGPASVLTCRAKGDAPLPRTVPPIVWRGGLDLNPLDVTSTDDMAWLTTLVWPEHDDRRERLAHAIDVAAADPPRLRRGDLLTDLSALVDEASAHGTVVVFHSAVIAYLEPTDRLAFDTMMRELVAAGRCHWVSNEGKRVLPSITATGPAIPEEKQTFVLGVDGLAVAHTHGHGRSMRWL
ncbi:DUF2332 domain-containing protein [Nocardioides sp. CER19]|uniref:DUF2332 domain-containing protein n=1 Tax=Nocardioides sp. CER19 TaxID=3038538 RepID=UPI00244A1CD9|nr:DUF2332 domain-containing protein [Nocardioides sp. CER19]MDH2416471.1 DUF2332 domain-containing protein [Nocardioides sp. CER19]